MVPRPLRFVIADEREIVQYVTADPMVAGTKETALWIGARSRRREDLIAAHDRPSASGDVA